MAKRRKSLRARLTLRGISTTRRHIYFYVLLVLITILANSLRNTADGEEFGQEQASLQQVTESVKLLSP